MHQFFVEPDQIKGKHVTILGSDVNHIGNVLRMKPGEEIAVSNGIDGCEYRCGILEIGQDRVECELRFIKEEGIELPSRITLYQGLPKADKMEMIVQKTTELGIYRIVPVACSRCVVRLDEKKAKAKCSRWQTIAESAAKQSRRRVIPRVADIMTFEEAVKDASGMKLKLIPYELASGMARTRHLIGSLKGGEDVAVFIGPEGGFEDQEIDTALKAGIEPVTLGKRILRTETAGITVLAWMVYQLEE